MDWRILFGTFGLMFLAELGDKTQLTALAFSAGSKSTWSVFLGACSALILSTLIAVLLGSVMQNQTVVPLSYIKIAAGILFLIFGVLAIRDGMVKEEPQKKEKVEIAIPGEGLLARIALNAASIFEESCRKQYLELAGQSVDPVMKELLKSLAEEELKHARRMKDLSERHPEETLNLSEIPETVNLEPLCWGIHPREAVLLDQLLKSELKAAEFYEQLARSSLIPSLKSAFYELAKEERNHAMRINRYSGANGAVS